ncbi:MAG: hydroxymethylbilane synthase, partial [Woeseia sp.]
ASAQGVLGVECLEDRDDLRALLSPLDHAVTRQTTLAERAVARVLEASCRSPVASYAHLIDGDVWVTALVAATDGSRILRRELSGPVETAEALGEKAARQLLELGAAELLHEAEQ